MKPDLLIAVSDPKPWIGSAYLTQPLRVLVVGESHKMPPGEEAPTEGLDFTAYTIRSIDWRICGSENSNFFANVEKIMFGEPQRLDQPGRGDQEIKARGDFWHSIAFANFVPRVMSSQDEKPRPEDFQAGIPRVVALMNALEPDLICIFSKKAFERRPWGEEPQYDGLKIQPEPIDDQLTRYPRASGNATYIAGFDHPSRGSQVRARNRFLAIRKQVEEANPRT